MINSFNVLNVQRCLILVGDDKLDSHKIAYNNISLAGLGLMGPISLIGWAKVPTKSKFHPPTNPPTPQNNINNFKLL